MVLRQSIMYWHKVRNQHMTFLQKRPFGNGIIFTLVKYNNSIHMFFSLLSATQNSFHDPNMVLL